MNGVGTGQFQRALAPDPIGENVDAAAAPRQFVGEVRHEDFNAAEIGSEALGGDGYQINSLSSQSAAPGRTAAFAASRDLSDNSRA